MKDFDSTKIGAIEGLAELFIRISKDNNIDSYINSRAENQKIDGGIDNLNRNNMYVNRDFMSMNQVVNSNISMTAKEPFLKS